MTDLDIRYGTFGNQPSLKLLGNHSDEILAQ